MDIVATKQAMRFAQENRIDISKVKGSGQKGRILVKDVTQFQSNGNRPPSGSFAELGTTGLEMMDGMIQKAHTADLYWPGVFPLYSRIRRSDPEIAIIRQGFASLGSKAQVQYIADSTEPSDTELEAIDFGNEVLDDIADGMASLLQNILSNVPFYGWGSWEHVWGMRHEEWRPPDKDEDWASKYNDGRIGIRRFSFRDPSTFVSWEQNDKGRVNGWVQRDYPEDDVTLPMDKLLHLTFGDNNSPEGLSPLEAVWRLERIKYNLEMFQGMGYEHASGHASFEVDRDPTTGDKSLIKAAAKALLSGQAGNFILLPNHIRGEIVDVTFGVADAILNAIKYYGILKLQIFQMQWVSMSTTTGVGSHAAMADASTMFMHYFNSMLEGFVRQMDKQLTRRLFNLNATAFPGLEKLPKLSLTPLSKGLGLVDMAGFISNIKNAVELGPEDEISIRKKTEGYLVEQKAEDQEGYEEPEATPIEEDTEETDDIEEDEVVLDREEEIEAMINDYLVAQFQFTGGYPSIRGSYFNNLLAAFQTYLTKKGVRITKYRNDARKTIARGFVDAFYIGYFSGGLTKVDSVSLRWLASRQSAELGHVDELFNVLRELKKDGDVSVASGYADSYTDTLDGIYLEGKMRGNLSVMLTFSGVDGVDSCRTCVKWSGKRHSADFWVRRGLIPGQPGNPNFECGGYRCKHNFLDDDGNDYEFL